MHVSHAPIHHHDVMWWMIFVLLGLLALGAVLGCASPSGLVRALRASAQLLSAL